MFLLLGNGLLVSTGQAQAQTQDDVFEGLPDGLQVQTVLTDMYDPVDMVFAPDGSLFYTEKNTGNVRLFHDGVLEAKPVITFDVGSCAERGLTGITLDPHFADNHYIYVYYAQGPECINTVNKLVRFTEQNGTGSDRVTLFTSPAYDQYHMGGGLHFGPDGMLYVSIGDTSNPSLAQDLTQPQGKFHRLNPDGTAAAGNPDLNKSDALPTIYAYGFRNPFDFTFDPVSAHIFGSENGPDCDDEMNLILPGSNYGWRPNYPCEDSTTPDPAYNTNPPLWHVQKCCVAPTVIMFYTGDQIPQWKNQLFMASYSGRLYHFVLEDDRTTLRSVSIVGPVSANMAIATGPDGAFYYLEGGGASLGTLKRIVGPDYQESLVKAAQPADPHAAPVPVPGEGSYTFDATGQTVNGIFLQYWQQNGGLSVLGYPISPVMGEISSVDNKLYTVQYFERAVLEYHPEQNPPFRVLDSQLGRERYKQLYPDGAPNQQADTAPDTVLVPETGMHLGGQFLAYWQSTGGVAVHGYPISDEFTEVSPLNGQAYTVQYFERSVLELHPENPAPFQVEQSQLGTFEYKANYAQ